MKQALGEHTPHAPLRGLAVRPFEPADAAVVRQLVLYIQQIENQVPITLEEQPDLLAIPDYYQRGKGNFWVAFDMADGSIVGSIALLDTGHSFATIRKMFVHKDYRGGAYGAASALYQTLESWVRAQHFEALYLGTLDRLQAAMRFYEKMGFSLLPAQALPEGFPRMAVDNRFFEKVLRAG
jgi:GNAT superfamily N-acetyltransferase